jgi:pimeloyl-ACP methyl ester carboxylesterase
MNLLKPYLLAPVLALSLTVGSLIPVTATAAGPTCEQYLKPENRFSLKWPTEYARKLVDRLSSRKEIVRPQEKATPDFDYLSDHDYLQDRKQRYKMGIVRSVFNKELDTRIYFTATGPMDAKGNPPVTDPNAKALYIYFHGSGTDKASGSNFAYKMNKMAMLGYSVIAMDLPFHAEGSRSKKMLKDKFYYENLHKLVEEYRIKGKPVYLVGHSFGPDLAAEFVQRYPFDVDGIAMISPAGFTKVLSEWYNDKTTKMQAFWKDSPKNDDGAAWAGVISKFSSWYKARTKANPDPTIVNPRLKIRVLSGDREEYVPGELDERGLPTEKKRDYNLCAAIAGIFAKVICRIEPGVGHYIFEHRDENGHDVILREMLALDEQTLFNEKQLKAEAKAQVKNELEEVLVRYGRETLFRAYVDSNLGGPTGLHRLIAQGDIKVARKIILDFTRFILPQRERAMIDNIINTKNWNPSFYGENKAEIDAIDLKKPAISDQLLAKYLTLVESMTPEQRAHYATVPKSVLVVPERQAPPADMQRPKKQKDKDAPPAAA